MESKHILMGGALLFLAYVFLTESVWDDIYLLLILLIIVAVVFMTGGGVKGLLV